MLAQPRERNGRTKIFRKAGQANPKFTETTSMIFSRSGKFIGKWWHAWGRARTEKTAIRQPARASGVVFTCFARHLQTSSMIFYGSVRIISKCLDAWRRATNEISRTLAASAGLGCDLYHAWKLPTSLGPFRTIVW